MNYLKSKDFWEAAGNRAIRTIAQVIVASVGASRLEDIDWKYIVLSAFLAGLLSILTSIATGLPEAEE